MGDGIYFVDEYEQLDGYDLEDVKKLDPDWFVYAYEHGMYDGNGFAIWRKNNKYGYSDLGHCSCYGPTHDLSTIYYDSLEDLRKIENNYGTYATKVYELIKQKGLT